MNLTLLYNNLRDVIPAKAGIQIAPGPEGPPSGVEPPLGWNLAQRKRLDSGSSPE